MRNYRDNFKSNQFETQVIYASKAFNVKEMVRLVKKEGLGLDCVSLGEMYTAITVYDGTTSGQTAGGYVKASTGKDINFIVLDKNAPIAVSKQDKMRIFSPDENQTANAWKMDYRRYHDIWVKDNMAGSIYVNVKDAA